MIKISVIPASTATAQELLVEITENVCRPYCINSTAKPTGTVTFTIANKRVMGGITLAQIIASVTVVNPSVDGCGCATTQVMTETFEVAFTASGTNVISIVPGLTTLTEPTNVKCCKAKGIKLITTLAATIA